jgi:IS605 OrfB family transposase
VQATFQAKIADESLYPAFDAIAELYGRAERHLYVDLYVRARDLNECKSEYLVRFGLTARQFNATRVDLGGRVDALRESHRNRVEDLERSVRATRRAVADLEKRERSLAERPKRQRYRHDARRAEERRRVRFRLHQNKRRLAALEDRLRVAQRDGAPGPCFGSRRLFRAQFHLADNGYADHAAWLADWRRTRTSQFLCLGSHDETTGNQTCTAQPGGVLRLRVPPALADRFGTYVFIHGIRFPYGQAAVETAVAAGKPVTYRFLRRTRKGRDVWYVHATVDVAAAEVTTVPRLGAVGADLNTDHIAGGEVDRFGNPVAARSFPVVLYKRSRAQVEASLSGAVADLVAWAKSAGKPIVIERLDFAGKKSRLREIGDRQARLLSGFAYRRFHALLCSRAAREGVEVITVNPAYTSVIGFVKFGPGYGLSRHATAAVAIARRGLGLRERLRSRSALPLPVRNRGRHVWSDWNRVARGLRAGSARGRRPSEGARGGGAPPSSAAPVCGASRAEGPPWDGLSVGPGCDSPAQIVGRTVRPAS